MGQKANLTQVSVQGLATNPNANALPAGSCAQAENVTLRRPGMIAPMAADHDVATVPVTFHSVKMLYDEHSQQVMVVGVDAPGSVTENSVGGLTPYTPALPTFTVGSVLSALANTYNGATRNIGFLPGRTQAAYNHFRSLVTEKWGVIVNRERWAGLTSPACLLTSTTGTWLLAGNSVGYRANYTLEHTVTGESYTLQGPPSSVTAFFNDTGADKAIIVGVATPQDEPTIQYGLLSGYELYVNVYRTKQDTVTTVDELADEFRRVAKIKVTSTSDTLITFTDNVTEEAQAGGEPLYTNPGQEGPDQASYAPPAASDICIFKDSTFYANRSAFPTLNMFIPGAFGTLLTATERTYGVGERPVIGGATITTGSAVVVLASAADAVGLKAGQTINNLTYFAAGTYIVSVVGLNVTMSTVALSTDAAATPTFYDRITIKQTFATGSTTTISGRVTRFDEDTRTTTGVSGFRLLHDPFDYRRNVPSINLTAINLYPTLNRCTKLEIYVTNGQNYSPAFTGSYTSLTVPLVSLQDTRPNLVYVSKTAQPESVPIANSLQIGAGVIQKMWANQSAIFFFCTDGLWKVTGDDFKNFQVSQVDPTVRLLHPDCVTSVNNQIYAWITDGIALVTEQGTQVISTDAIGPEIRAAWTTLGGSPGTSVITAYPWGPGMSGDSYFNEVFTLARLWYNPEIVGNNWVQSWLYNDDTKNFSTQDHEYLASVYVPSVSRVVYLFQDSTSTRVQIQSDYSSTLTQTYRGCEVWFNPLQTEDKGNLKQWMDLYFFVIDAVPGDGSPPDWVKALFDSRATMTDSTDPDVNVRDLYTNRRDLHYWVPRRAALGDQLQIGFRTEASEDSGTPYFQFQGFKLRYRVASDTLLK